ncbi:hypothetical protein VST7929_00161 [Vibrio stylophorae]|uniref:Type II secretion system protein K n=1 Tax=Vibrio stylophorae TaxID=659351 RepID=A0ABM8ZPW1_9VIBR|nr:type II secretion system minor pseudopilin GspK [Vibrio stylophorae]CAH0532343.1 hypothetical protein VST7929_00161 [Vibrio stylophorae]
MFNPVQAPKHHLKSLTGKQGGVALVMVLLILAIMTTLAATMSKRLWQHFYRAEALNTQQQAYWYGLGVEQLAIAILKKDIADNEVVNLSQNWARGEQTFPIDEATTVGKITDMQRCLNVNALAVANEGDGVNRPYLVEVLQRTLEQAQIEPYQAETVADSVWEYLDLDDAVQSAFGAEDSYYAGQNPGYLTANGVIADISELRAIQGVTPKMMGQITPLLCALPDTRWLLNINTITADQAPILAALLYPSISLSQVQQLIEQRPYDGWSDLDSFWLEPALSGLDDATKDRAVNYLTTTSHYFELDAEIQLEPARVRERALLKRNADDQFEVVRRRYGGVRERAPDDSTK